MNTFIRTMKRLRIMLVMTVISLTIFACGGGGGGDNDGNQSQQNNDSQWGSMVWDDGQWG